MTLLQVVDASIASTNSRARRPQNGSDPCILCPRPASKASFARVPVNHKEDGAGRKFQPPQSLRPGRASSVGSAPLSKPRRPLLGKGLDAFLDLLAMHAVVM